MSDSHYLNEDQIEKLNHNGLTCTLPKAAKRELRLLERRDEIGTANFQGF